MINKSETIREWIREQLDLNFDFSDSAKRRAAFQEKFETQPELEITWKKQYTLFLNALQDICKEKGIDPTTYNLSRPKVKFTQQTNSGVVTVTPKPKGSQNIIQTQPNQNQPNQQGIIQPQAQNQFHLTPDESKDLTKITVKTLGNVIHYGVPKFRKFDDGELDILTPAWHPILAPILERAEGKYAAALLATLAVLSDRAGDFKKKPDEVAKTPDKEKTKEKMGGDEFEKWKKEHGVN